MLDIEYDWGKIFTEKMLRLFPNFKTCEGDLGGTSFVKRTLLNRIFYGECYVSISTAGVDFGKSYAPETVCLAVYNSEGMRMVEKFCEENPAWKVKVNRY